MTVTHISYMDRTNIQSDSDDGVNAKVSAVG